MTAVQRAAHFPAVNDALRQRAALVRAAVFQREDFVFAELRKAISWSRTRPRLFHYRTRSGGEVDFMLEDAAGRCVGIEVKAGASAGGRDFRGLRELGETLGERFLYGLLLYAGREPVPFGKKLHAVPLENLWTVAAEHVSGLEDGMEAEETP